MSEPHSGYFTAPLADTDPEVAAAIAAEAARQNDQIELIASENIVSRAVLEAQGSILTNKTVEGYPGRRYHGGATNVDAIERLAVDRALPVVRLYLRQRATAFGESGQPRRLAGANSTGGDTARHGSGLGRTSQSRGPPPTFRANGSKRSITACAARTASSTTTRSNAWRRRTHRS